MSLSFVVQAIFEDGKIKWISLVDLERVSILRRRPATGAILTDPDITTKPHICTCNFTIHPRFTLAHVHSDQYYQRKVAALQNGEDCYQKPKAAFCDIKEAVARDIGDNLLRNQVTNTLAPLTTKRSALQRAAASSGGNARRIDELTMKLKVSFRERMRLQRGDIDEDKIDTAEVLFFYVDGDGEHPMAIIMTENMARFAHRCKFGSWHMAHLQIEDGTFEHRAKGWDQVYGITGTYTNATLERRESHCIALALLPDRETETYEALWLRVMQRVIAVNGDIGEVSTAIYNFDFELGASTACRNVLGEFIVLLGCLFHKIKKNGDKLKGPLMNFYMRNETFRRYYRNTWLADCRRQLMRHFDSVGPRTTNAAKSMHARFNDFFHGQRNVGNWAADAQKWHNYWRDDLDSLIAGRAPKSRERKYIEADWRIEQAKQQLREGAYDGNIDAYLEHQTHNIGCLKAFDLLGAEVGQQQPLQEQNGPEQLPNPAVPQPLLYPANANVQLHPDARMQHIIQLQNLLQQQWDLLHHERDTQVHRDAQVEQPAHVDSELSATAAAITDAMETLV